MELANIQDEKVFNEEVAKLRKKYIIMSDTTTGGYWRSNNKEELQEFIKKYQHRSYDNNRMIMLAYIIVNTKMYNLGKIFLYKIVHFYFALL